MFNCLNFEVLHELAIYSHTTFKAHLLGLLGQHIFADVGFDTAVSEPSKVCNKVVASYHYDAGLPDSQPRSEASPGPAKPIDEFVKDRLNKKNRGEREQVKKGIGLIN